MMIGLLGGVGGGGGGGGATPVGFEVTLLSSFIFLVRAAFGVEALLLRLVGSCCFLRDDDDDDDGFKGAAFD